MSPERTFQFLVRPALTAVLTFCLCARLAPPAQAQANDLPPEKTYEEWDRLCSQLPTFRTLQNHLPPRRLLPLQTFAELGREIDHFFALSTTGALARAEFWVGPPPETSGFPGPARAYRADESRPFQPFAQKQMVPPAAEVFFHGDLHGDIHSLIEMLHWMNRGNYLKGFTLVRTNTYLIFLGDFTDRGLYSVEVLYTLLRLKRANPDRIFVCRGNHEDLTMMMRYGSFAEGTAKYGESFDALKIARVFDFLPVVLYLGCGTNFIQCNHAGMEPRYGPAKLLEAHGEFRLERIGDPSHQLSTINNPPCPGVFEDLAGGGDLAP